MNSLSSGEDLASSAGGSVPFSTSFSAFSLISYTVSAYSITKLLASKSVYTASSYTGAESSVVSPPSISTFEKSGSSSLICNKLVSSRKYWCYYLRVPS
jgi:hypothetical protein